MANKKVGSIVFATDQGLGYLAKDFYDHGIIQEVLVQPHSSRESHLDWYPNRCRDIDELLNKIDVLLIFETPFNWKIIPRAREKGIKTVLIPMYECTQYPFPYEPDEVWCPSALDLKFYKDKGQENLKQIQIPIPDHIKWRLRKKAEVFIHNAGNGGLGGRNGTNELLQAMEFVKSPIKLIIRTQSNGHKINDPRITYITGTVPKEELWEQGDVFIFPEKFNGLSLPLQEAYASGMLVMTTNRFPNTEYLPHGPLIRVNHTRKERIAVEFEISCFQPKDIAFQIDNYYGKNISPYSMQGKKYNSENRWNKLKPVYEELLNNLWKQ